MNTNDNDKTHQTGGSKGLSVAAGMKTVRKYKRLITAGAFAVLIVLVALFAYMAFNNKPEPPDPISVPIAIRKIGQLATLEYHYQEIISIIEEEEFKLLGLWDIDPGEKILIVQYDGTIKLGVDFEKIRVNQYHPNLDGKTKFEIKLPDVEIISSETPQDSFEVLLDKGIYTNKSVEISDFYAEAAARQALRDVEVLSGDFVEMALENAKSQIGALVNSFYESPNDYEIIWAN